MITMIKPNTTPMMTPILVCRMKSPTILLLSSLRSMGSKHILKLSGTVGHSSGKRFQPIGDVRQSSEETRWNVWFFVAAIGLHTRAIDPLYQRGQSGIGLGDLHHYSLDTLKYGGCFSLCPRRGLRRGGFCGICFHGHKDKKKQHNPIQTTGAWQSGHSVPRSSLTEMRSARFPCQAQSGHSTTC